jgi:hypothetical protein
MTEGLPNQPSMEQKPLPLALRGMYFVCSFIAAGPLAIWLSEATTGGSNFEGGQAYAVLLKVPFWFGALVLLFWLAYKPLRKNPPAMGLVTAIFALATIPFFTWVASLLPGTSYPNLPTLTEPAAAPDSYVTSTLAAGAEVLVERDKHGMPIIYSVVAYGYNYTDNYIDSFEVDGAGGGNLAVSTPTSPGGGDTCCALVTSGLPVGTEFTIRWTRDRRRWCEKTVKLTKPVPIKPRYFEVHFYRDGHIEIEVTQKASPPRLNLERFSIEKRFETGNVHNDEKFSRCKDGY